MAYRDWLKEYRESQGKKSTSTTSSTSTAQTTTSGSSGSGASGGSFRDYLKEYREKKSTESLQGWAEYTSHLLSDIQKSANKWQDETAYQTNYSKISEMLSLADKWRKQYSGNTEAVSYIDSVANALSQAKYVATDINKYHSQWKTEDDYNSWYADQKDKEQKLSDDLDSRQKELDELLEVQEKYNSGVETLKKYYLTNDYTYVSKEEVDQAIAYAQIAEKKYGITVDKTIDKIVNEKKLYLSDAKRLQEGAKLSSVSGNADFKDFSGYVSTEADGVWGKLTSQYGMGYEDLTYEYINGAENGKRSEILSKNRSYSSDSKADTSDNWTVYDHMTEDEIGVYNYHYAKDGKEAAQKYLDSIQETLNARKAGKMYANMEDKTLLELAFGVAAGLDQFKSGAKGAWNAITGNDEYIPASATQMASGMVREDLADETLPVWYNFKKGQWEDQVFGRSVGQAAYDAITTTANMAPSVMTSWALSMVNPVAGSAWVTAGQIAGTGMMGASAAGNAYQEVINLGYDKDQAQAYAAMVGASEAGLQYLLGGIGKLGGKLSGNVLTKMMNGIDNAFARTAIKLGGNMLSEGLEEGLQEILTPWFQNLILHTDNEVDWNEVAYSSLLGALTAGFMEGTSTISGEVNTYKTGKSLQAADISAQRLAELGKTFSADTVAYQLAGRVNENTGAYTMGRLFNEIGATLSEQNVTEITNALVSKGMDETTAGKNAKALAYVVEGGQLSERQIAAIEANEVLAEVARTTLIDANTTWNQRSVGYNDMLKSLADEMASPKASRTAQAQQGVENAPTSDTVDGQTKNGTESRSEAESVDTSPAKVQSFSAIERGQATIKLEDGSEVSVKDADLAPDDGVRIETIASIEGISATDATFVLNTLRTNTGASAQMDALGAKEAYKYGFYGFSMEHMTKHGVFANSLTESQRQAIYETGKKARQQQIEMATPKSGTGTGKQTEIYFDSGNGNVVAFRDAKKTLTEKQTAGVQAAMILRKLGIGGDIYFFESYRNDKGQLVYKDKNGNEKKAPNGWYSPGDGSIHIDLNAGNGGKGFVLFTLAHELTHFIEQWSPQKYKVLADFLVENYEKGQSVDGLVRAKQAKLSAQRGKKVSYKEAYSEVVADSMEAMLADGNVLEKLVELKAKDNALFTKMKQFFDNLLNKIRGIYNGQTPDTAEGRAVLEMTDSIEKIQQLFAEALVDAGENFQAAEKNTTKDGGVRFMSRDGMEIMSFTVPRGDKVNADLYIEDRLGVLLEDIRNHLPELRLMAPVFELYGTEFQKNPDDTRSLKQKVKDFFDSIGNKVERKELGVVALNNAGAHDSLEHGYGPIKAACFAALPSVIEKGLMFGPSRYMDRGYDTYLFVAPVHFVGTKKGEFYVGAYVIRDVNTTRYKIHEVLTINKEGNRPFKPEADQNGEHLRDDSLLDTKVTQPTPVVKSESVDAIDLALDENTESVAPAVLMSERTWTESDYVQEREQAAKEIAQAIGVSVKKAKAYIDSVNSIAKMIADDRVRLDYFSSPGRSSFVGNVEYGGSFDFSTLCKKRRLLTGTFTAIQKALPNTALTADEILDIRNRMKDAGLEVSCGLCYVEGSRANMGQFAKEFLRLYKQYYPDAWQPNMADVNTPDGIEWVRINHPECYEQYEYFWNHYGTLKAGDKNLFASQQKPKLYQLHTEYKGEILEKFNDDDNVEEKNLNGGIRLQSFSDFEIVHLIDTMQIIMDMSRVGLAGQAYTKVPDFAWALGDTGLKINLSLIAKGVDENGRLIFDDVEGMPIDKAVELRNRYSKNVGTILVAFNDEQLLAAMADERVDYIIPFHRSQWKKSQYGAMGLPAKTKDYTYMQNEKFIKPQFHEYRGRMVQDKATNYMPNEYWDFSKSGKKNAEAYLEMCARNNKRPKFYKLLQNNGDGSYSLKADGSTDGYWKLLIDFKMYDNNGVGSPQMPVKPDFNMDEATRMLDEYSGGHSNFPVAQSVVDSFVEEYKDSHKGVQFSDRDSDGNQLSEDQLEYFENSQARNRNGNLQVVYHGGTVEYEFDTSRGGKGDTQYGPGSYFTDSEYYAKEYTWYRGGNVRAYYLNIEKMFDDTNMDITVQSPEWQKLEQILRSNGIEDKFINQFKSAGFAYMSRYLAVKAGAKTSSSWEGSEKLNAMIREAGFQGIKGYLNDSYQYVIFTPNQAKLTTNEVPSSFYDTRYSDRDNTPTFYSQMARVVDGLKDGKYGASSVISMLRDPKRGVKKEEIKWSGIEAWLEGKKSVTKADLQEFIAGSMLQIEEEILDNKDRPYTEDQKKRLGEYKAKQDEVTKRVADEWKKITGKDLPISIRNAATESGVVNAIIDANKEHKDASFDGRLLKKLNKDLREVIENNDYFGFDSVDDALRSIYRHRRDFIKNIDASTNDKAVIVKYCNALNAYNELPNMISDEDTDRLRAIAREGDQYSRKMYEVMREHDKEQEKYTTNWDQYKIKGGRNYREMLFRIPGSTYTNEAMMTHWKDRGGVLAHARVQDMDTFLGKMLFIEEIQSDWHNEGHKSGYESEISSDERAEFNELEKVIDTLSEQHRSLHDEKQSLDFDYFKGEKMSADEYFDKASVLVSKLEKITAKLNRSISKREKLYSKIKNVAPDAPFKDTYHEYVLKRLLREAAEQDYDSIGWTTAETQDERWQNNLPHKEGTGKSGFLVAYRNVYDRRMKKFLSDFGKKWGTSVGKTVLDNGTEVWSMAITDEMKDSVLYEGQPKYSMPKQGAGDKNKNRAISGSPLTRRSVKQRSVGSTHVSMSSTAAADILGISNIAELDDSVKNVIAKLGELFVSVDQREPVLGFKRTIDAGNLEGSLVSLGILKREGTSGSAYRYDNGHGLRLSNHSAHTENFVGEGEHLSIALFERGKMNAFVEGESNVIEAVFRRRYLDNNPEVLKCVIHDIAHFIVTGEYHDTAGALRYNFSGTDSFKEQANQRMVDDKIAREMKLKSPNSHGMSPRQLLADAFDELVQTPDERKLMDQYRSNISKVEDVQERLRKLRAEISKLTKSKGDKAKIAELNKTAKELAELIDKYDRKLLDLEASKPLKDVLARARSAAYQEARKRSEENLKEYRQQVSERFDRGVENRRKTEMRKKIRRVIRDLDKILNRGDKKRNVKEDMKDFVAEALSAAEVLFTDNYTNEDIVRNGFGVELSKEEIKYLEEARKYMDELANLPVGGYDAWQARQEAEESLKSKLAYRMSKLKDAFFRERQRLNKAEVAEVLGNLADAYAKLEDSEYAYVNGAYHEAVYEYLKMLQDDVGGAKVKDMTLGQLEELYKAYTMVLTTVQNANKMFADDLKQSKEELANRVMMEVYQAGGEHGLWSKSQLARNQASWNNTKPIYAAERTGSSTFVKLVKGLFKGQYNWAIDMEEAKAFRQKVAEKYGFKNWDMEKTYKFTSSSGIEFELNLNQIMSLYAYAKREQAHDHLLKGGFVFGKNTEVVVTKNGIKRTYLNKSAKAHNISDEIMDEIVSKLSNEQRGFVDEMQDYLSTTMGEKGNEVSMRIYGVKLFMEKFYFPLRSAGQFKEKAKEAELKQQQGQISIVNSGFTKAITPKASNPVVLDGFTDVWAGHVNEMSLYHSMVLPMEDFRRVYNYASPHMEGQESASVNSFIENAYGDAATGYFDQLYKELNGGAIVDPRENLSKQRIGKFKKAAVMLSNSVWVQQFSAIGRAYALIDPQYFIGSKVDKKKHAVLWAELKQYAPVAIIKEMGGFDTHTGLSAKDYLLAEKYGKGERIKGFVKDEQYRGEIMGHLPTKADELTWCSIWEAVKRETKAKNSNLDVRSEEFLKKAGERFSEVIEKTQVYDSVLARSANMRSKQGLMQMLTSFLAEPTTTVNMVEDALRKGDKKTIARTFGAVAASIVLNNALASIIYAMRDDDEDENFLEKYAQAFASGMLDDINPMTYYPVLKDIWSLFQGYDVERTDMAIYSDIADSVKKIVTLIAKYDSDMDDEDSYEYFMEVHDALLSLLDAGASAFGIPWKNVRRDLMSYYNTYKTFASGSSTTWNSFVDAVGGAALDTIPIVGLVAGESNTDKLYDAIISGDTTYVNRLKSGYKDQNAINNAIRKGLRENDPRIRQAAIAWNANDLDEYMRIAKEIIAEKHFVQDDVVMAIRSEANALAPDAETETVSKAKGLFTAEKFAEAIAQGDQAMANAIKTDIIQTAEKNGKSADEAVKSFVSSAKTELKELFLSGDISDQEAISALTTYCGSDEDGAIADVQYWAFKQDYPDVYADDQWFDTYYEKVADSGISIDLYMEYRNKVSTITGENKKAGRMAVINSLPISSAQKDALYLAEGWAKSKLYEAPWH